MVITNIEGLGWMSGEQVLEEIVGALNKQEKYRGGLLYRAFETEDSERVLREGTDRYNANQEGGMPFGSDDSYGDFLDADIEFGQDFSDDVELDGLSRITDYDRVVSLDGRELDIRDYVFAAEEGTFGSEIEDARSGDEVLFVSVYDNTMMRETQNRAAYEFVDKNNKPGALVALFRII